LPNTPTKQSFFKNQPKILISGVLSSHTAFFFHESKLLVVDQWHAPQEFMEDLVDLFCRRRISKSVRRLCALQNLLSHSMKPGVPYNSRIG
jgi:hypothetical protein